MADEWFAVEFASLDLQHKRRRDRTLSIVQRMAEHPSGSIVETFTEPKDWKAVYRFLASQAFPTEALEQALQQACRQRCAAHDLILAVQDTTDLVFPASPALADADDGLWVHSTLAVSPEGVPLGVLHQQRWTRRADEPATRQSRRQRPFEEKESYRWLVHVFVNTVTC